MKRYEDRIDPDGKIRWDITNDFVKTNPEILGFREGHPGPVYHMSEVLIFQMRPGNHYMIRKAIWRRDAQAFVNVDGEGYGMYAYDVWGWKPLKEGRRA